ncbi:unnamed protein product [Heligmosomoides polygyrus]|uniref:Uncharacterized protein n=1 Tax=Heligmosomoides polygyrus TaxID=6339 RepID=A0A183GUE1_HELPZ|nr:unnamed protein product [Heligmosomoides polygyrus]
MSATGRSSRRRSSRNRLRKRHDLIANSPHKCPTKLDWIRYEIALSLDTCVVMAIPVGLSAAAMAACEQEVFTGSECTALRMAFSSERNSEDWSTCVLASEALPRRRTPASIAGQSKSAS